MDRHVDYDGLYEPETHTPVLTTINLCANCMTRNRFFKLRNHLTLVDNNSVSDDDKAADRMWKVRPFIERVCKTSMGGVDMCDRMIAYHKISSRTRRWNLRVLLHFVDLVLSNSWLEWKKDGNSGLQLYDFRISVATSLMNAAEESDDDDDIRRLPKKNAIVGLPTDPYRTSSASHLPVWEDLKNSARCRREGCRFKTRIKCTKCGVFLCTTSGRNCFKDFHE